MRRWRWTAEHCFNQLLTVGVHLSLLSDGKLKIRAPGTLDLNRVLSVIRKYKPGLMRILRRVDQPPSRGGHSNATLGESPAAVPAGLQETLDAVRGAFEDFTVEIVSVSECAQTPSDSATTTMSSSRQERLAVFGLTKVIAVSMTPPLEWDGLTGEPGEVFITTRIPTPTAGAIVDTGRLLPGGAVLGRGYRYWLSQAREDPECVETA